MLRQIKTDAFEATVIPFNELPFVEQIPYLVAGADMTGPIFASVIADRFRNSLAPEKLAEFDRLNTTQVMEVLTQYLETTDNPKSICEHGHANGGECVAYDQGRKAERQYLIASTVHLPRRLARKVARFLTESPE